MTDMQTIRDDLAFMRALAQEGRRAPLLGGPILVAAGVIYAAASLTAWALATGALRAPTWWQGGVWLVATVLYVPVVMTLGARGKGRPGASATTNRATRAGWMGIGAAIGALLLGYIAAGYETRSAVVWATIPSVILALYGAGWTVAAAMSDRGWTRWVAAGCFASAVVMGLLCTSAWVYLAYAASLLLLAAAPGLALMRAEPSDVV